MEKDTETYEVITIYILSITIGYIVGNIAEFVLGCLK